MSIKKIVKDLVSQFNFATDRSQEIAESLLSRAVEEGREEKTMAQIRECFERINDMPEDHKAGIALARQMDELCGNSQALRTMSLRDGRIYEDTTLKLAKPTLH